MVAVSTVTVRKDYVAAEPFSVYLRSIDSSADAVDKVALA